MSFSATTVTAGPYTANGITTTFAFTFKCLAADEIEVFFKNRSTLIEATISGYDVIGVGDNDGGSVVFEVAPLSSVSDIWVRAKPREDQSIVLVDQTRYNAAQLEGGLDRATQRLNLLQSQLSGVGGPADWNTLLNKPAFGTMARAYQPWKVVDDWLNAAGASTPAQVTAGINLALSTAVYGDKFVIPSPSYTLYGKLNWPNVDDVIISSGGRTLLVQNKANEPHFEMACATTVGGFGVRGFRFRWLYNAAVAWSNDVGHLVGDTNAIGLSLRAAGADGNGEYNWFVEDCIFENGFRGVSPNYDNTVLGGADFPIWGMRCTGLTSFQNMKGALLTLGNWGSGGGPRYTIGDIYDNAINPVEASIQCLKGAGISGGAWEFNNTIDQSRVNLISTRGVFVDTVRFEHMTLTTRNTSLIGFSSSDSGRASFGEVEYRSTHITIGDTLDDGLVYGLQCFAGAEATVLGGVTIQDTTAAVGSSVDKFIHNWPRTDDLGDIPEGDPIPEGRPYPPGKIYLPGGYFLDEGPDGDLKQGISHFMITDGPNIRFSDEEIRFFGVAVGGIVADWPTVHFMDTAIPGFTEYKMDRPGWIKICRLEVVGGPVTSGAVRLILYKNGAPINWVSRVFGDSFGGTTTETLLDLDIPFGRYDDTIYGGSGADTHDVWFNRDDILQIGYIAVDVSVPDPATLALRASLRISSRSGTGS